MTDGAFKVAGNAEPWFALHVRSRFENLAATMLSGQGFEIFLPTYRTRRNWSDRIKELELPLFPGYVFCRFELGRRLPILKTPGVLGIVSAGRSPIAVRDAEIGAIQTAIGSGRRLEPWPFMQPGDRVLIQNGALKGIEGTLVEAKGKYRLLLSIDLLQRAVALEIDASAVKLVESARRRRGLAGGLTVPALATTT